MIDFIKKIMNLWSISKYRQDVSQYCTLHSGIRLKVYTTDKNIIKAVSSKKAYLIAQIRDHSGKKHLLRCTMTTEKIYSIPVKFVKIQLIFNNEKDMIRYKLIA